MTKDEFEEKTINLRRSRFVWLPDEIEIIKNPDQEANLKPAQPSPLDPAPAAPIPTKDDDRQDG